MAKRKRSKRTKKINRTSKSLRVDVSLLLAVIDELNELGSVREVIVRPISCTVE